MSKRKKDNSEAINETVGETTGEAIDATPIPPAEEIDRFYWNGGLQYQALEQGLTLRHLPEHALHYLKLEKEWMLEETKEEEWLEEEARTVGLGSKCNRCGDNGRVERRYTGVVTKLRITMPYPCPCLSLRNFYSRWYDPSNVPVSFRAVTLYNLETYHNNLNGFTQGEKLDSLLAQVRKYEDSCYLLVGPAGTGKSTLMLGMYHRALLNWAEETFYKQVPVPAVFKVHATALAKQNRDWAMRNDGRDADTGKPTPYPEVTVELVLAAVRAGYTPCLFIEELDKIKTDSNFQAIEFAALIDAVQSNGGQVVVTSNSGELKLKYALGEQFGPAIIRRLCGPRLNPDNPDHPDDPEKGGFLVDFWKGTIIQNHRINIPKQEGLQPKPEVRGNQGNQSTASQGSNNTPASEPAVPEASTVHPAGFSPGTSQGSQRVDFGSIRHR